MAYALKSKTFVQAALQLAGTFLIVYFFPYTLLKPLVLIAFWWVLLRPLSREEVIIFILASLFFVIMDAVVIAQGKLVFSESFVFGVPAWELFMWGFTTVHAKRLTFLNDKPVFWAPGLVLMLFYMIIFSIPIGDTPLFAASAALLILGLFFKHDPLTLRYTGYLLLLGFLYETTGVASGLWHYPKPISYRSLCGSRRCGLERAFS